MQKLKKGDIVITKNNGFNEFNVIGLVRKVVMTTSDYHVQLDKPLHKQYSYDYLYIQDRFKKLEDNAMNRLLYPEAFNE